ncbi:ubiquitin carboxyl-terminal hydrolase 25-like [Pollicipes pollicipes]|uniref:ubiquitin carboxyl-terminal hydrolase 25-like n=1 Tax=Pollicipes pollicipes TaxID=41117 RepID=UPI001885799F|nr:ubiquitin carboxyl-terminal hydrolase 25-like [Pollicipes pollicipes]
MALLLEWLEEAFKYADTDAESGRGDRRSRNPMISLFYGQHKTEGVRDGLPYTQTETFGQFPLAVVPGQDLHQALEASVAAGPDAAASDAAAPGPHQWFTVLPPVLLLELSRFHFDQALGRTEKIHDRLTFPMEMYMDRYLEINKNIVTVKRAEIAQLRQTRHQLQRRLDQYLSFGASAPRLPLSRLLRHALQYARGSVSEPLLDVQDVEMETATSSSVTSMLVDSPSSSPRPARRAASQPSMPSTCSPAVADAVPTRLAASEQDGPRSSESALGPTHTSAEEMAVVQRCLERWTQEVDREVRELKRQIREIDAKIDTMFDEPGLRQVPYRLHSVLVHEGQAVSGHYWAYVFHPQRKIWLKFNDNTVTAATWDDLCLESVGGHHNTSAYCLVYIDVNRHELMDDRTQVDKESGMVDAEDEAQRLPLPLQQYVDEHNRAFQTELETWNSEPQPSDDNTQSMDSADAFGGGSSGDQAMPDPAERTQWEELSARHAAVSLPATLELLKATVADAPGSSARHWICEALGKAQAQARERCGAMDADPNCDYRMDSMPVYLVRNGARDVPDVRWLLLEHFTHPTVRVVPALRDLYQAASLELARLVEQRSEEERLRFRSWHVHYSEFRWVAWSTVLGLGHLAKGRYTESLLYLMQACTKNDKLIAEQADGRTDLGLDPDQLANFRRQAVRGLNKHTVEMFLSGNPAEATQLTQEGTVPALVDLAKSEREQDRVAAEDVRNKWCNLLEQTLDDGRQHALQTIITQLIEPVAERERPMVPIKVQGTEQLAQRYREALSRLKQDG